MTNIPTYEDYIEGKKLTLKQHAARRKKYNALYGIGEELVEDVPKIKHGRCEQCDSGSFKLKTENGNMTRTCKDCGDTKDV